MPTNIKAAFCCRATQPEYSRTYSHWWKHGGVISTANCTFFRTQFHRPLLANLTVSPHATIPALISGCVPAASVDWMALSPALLRSIQSHSHQNTAQTQHHRPIKNSIISILNNYWKKMKKGRDFGEFWGIINSNKAWWENTVGLLSFQLDL